MSEEFRIAIKKKIDGDLFIDNLKSLYVFSWDKKVVKMMDKMGKRDVSKIINKIPRAKRIKDVEDVLKILNDVISNRNNNI